MSERSSRMRPCTLCNERTRWSHCRCTAAANALSAPLNLHLLDLSCAPCSHLQHRDLGYCRETLQCAKGLLELLVWRPGMEAVGFEAPTLVLRNTLARRTRVQRHSCACMRQNAMR
eukprot:442562-Amphidinium_carterae.1